MKAFTAVSCFWTLTILSILVSPAATLASDLANTTQVETSFENVKFEVENAIIEQGFVIDYTGNIALMLENTINVVDDKTLVFNHAEFWQFCSSKITRELVKTNPANISYCPFVVFAYETVKEPGTVSIGYHRLASSSSEETNKSISKINSLLKNIVESASE